MTKYRISVSIDGENFFWIVVDNGRLIKNHTKEDLVGTRFRYYNTTNICDRCIEENKVTDGSILRPGNARREQDKEGNETGRWLCNKCKAKYYNNMQDSHKNIIKSLRDFRTGNQDPNSSNAKADRSQDLVCILYGWEDLNRKYDNHRYPLDCCDTKNGLYHQVQGRNYNSRHRLWSFTGFEDEWEKKFEDMICLCFDKDGKIVERVYEFPKKEIERVKGINIYKNPVNTIPWYEEFRVKDGDILKRANKIWKEKVDKKIIGDKKNGRTNKTW